MYLNLLYFHFLTLYTSVVYLCVKLFFFLSEIYFISKCESVIFIGRKLSYFWILGCILYLKLANSCLDLLYDHTFAFEIPVSLCKKLLYFCNWSSCLSVFRSCCMFVFNLLYCSTRTSRILVFQIFCVWIRNYCIEGLGFTFNFLPKKQNEACVYKVYIVTSETLLKPKQLM